jgi:hypothetical protein
MIRGVKNNTAMPRLSRPPLRRSKSAVSRRQENRKTQWPRPSSKVSIRASHRAPMARHWRMEPGPIQGTVNQPISKITMEPVSTPTWRAWRSPILRFNNRTRRRPCRVSARAINSQTMTDLRNIGYLAGRLRNARCGAARWVVWEGGFVRILPIPIRH